MESSIYPFLFHWNLQRVGETTKQDFGTASNPTNYEAHLTNTIKSKATWEQGKADTFATSNLKQDVDFPKVKHHYPKEHVQLEWETGHRKRKYVSEEALFHSVGREK